MGLIAKLEREAKGTFYSGNTMSLSDPRIGELLSAGSSVTGRAVNETSAMRVIAFFACIRLLAETMGAMPSAIYRKQKSGNAERADEHPLSGVLIEQPNADMNGVNFREASTANLAARGNGYALIQRRSDGNVSSLYPIPCAGMRIDRTRTDGKPYGIWDRGQVEWYSPEKIWHRRGFSFDGLMGISPLEMAREALGLAMAGEEFNARLFVNGLSPSVRVSIPQWLNPEQRKVAQDKIDKMAGLASAHKPFLLEGGMKLESGLLTPEEAQFLALRQFTVVEICRLLGIKPHQIAALERATDNNIERLSQEFVTFTMLPHFQRDERAARQLFKPADRDQYYYRYNFEGLLRADSAARAALYSILLQNGVASRNEVRAKENWNAIADPAMDQFTVQTNLSMIDQLAELVSARIAQSQAAASAANGDTP